MSQATPVRVANKVAERAAATHGSRRGYVHAASLYRGRVTAAKGHMGGPSPE